VILWKKRDFVVYLKILKKFYFIIELDYEKTIKCSKIKLNPDFIGKKFNNKTEVAMKKLIILFLFLIPFLGFSEWYEFGPSSIQTNDICFVNFSSGQNVICTSTGIFIEDSTGNWVEYSYGLAVMGAIPYDNENVMLILSGGSYSDGAYLFNFTTHQFTVLEWCYYPKFVIFAENVQKYFVGFQGGLITSGNGTDWTIIETFNDKTLLSMDYYENNLAVCDGEWVYFSTDGGTTWTVNSTYPPLISDLKYDEYGKLYGIFPGESWSSGLWSSIDNATTWEVEFWSPNMNTLGFDAIGNLFVGWDENTVGVEEGIALYNPETSDLQFLNEGLANLQINKIKCNPWMSNISIFCCTDAGVFFCNDYLGNQSQTIILESAFQFASSHIIPNNADMLVVLEEILNDNLVFVRNSQGQTLQKIGPNWVNNIGNWIPTEGYLIKMQGNDSFTIQGQIIDPQSPINLEIGFQFVAYLPEVSMDALDAFSSILTDNLDFIRNSNGNVLRKIGPNWVNGIGDCIPGEGYLIKMNGTGILVYGTN